MPTRTALGLVIRSRRLELGWTQEEFAARISADGEYVRQSEVSRIESGKVALPRRERLERIAEVLDLSLGELLARSGWAGAREAFGQLAVDGAITPPQVSEPSLSSVDTGGGDVTRSGAPAAAVGRVPGVEAAHRDAVRALRRALLTMRTESERLTDNRQQAYAIGRQFEEQQTNGGGWAVDQPEATDS